MYTENLAPQTRFVTARGLRQHLTCWGDPGWISAEKPALFMVHGWMDVGRSFQFVVDALAERGERRYVVAPDLRGYGLTETAQDSYWFQDYMGDLDALIDDVSPELPIDLLGHSMGGNVVMFYAGARPARIRRLVNLEGYGLPATTPEEAPGRLAQWLDELKQAQELKPYESYEAVAARLSRTNKRLAADKAAYIARFWAAERDGALHVLGDPAHKRVNPVLFREEELLAFYRDIRAPVLFVEGAASDLDLWWRGKFTREAFRRRFVSVPNGKIESIADAGHMLHHDRPDRVAELLADFLA